MVGRLEREERKEEKKGGEGEEGKRGNLSLVMLPFFVSKPRGEVGVDVVCVTMETIINHLVPFDFSC